MNYGFSVSAILVSLVSFITFSACNKADLPNESELITTINYVLIDSVSGDTSLFMFLDKDGDGGFEPLIRSSNLKSNRVYIGQLSLLNEAVTPPNDIGFEVQNESHAHQFFYIADGNLDLKINYADQDTLGYPLGLITRLQTGIPGSGNLRLVLRHQPDKTASGVVNGNISLAGGETDIDVLFPITIL